MLQYSKRSSLEDAIRAAGEQGHSVEVRYDPLPRSNNFTVEIDGSIIFRETDRPTDELLYYLEENWQTLKKSQTSQTGKEERATE